MGHSRLGGGKLQVQPCPQCPVSDGRPEKGGLSLRAQAVWKGVGMSTIVSGTLASAIVEYRSEQNRLPDRSLGTFVGIDLNARCPSA